MNLVSTFAPTNPAPRTTIPDDLTIRSTDAVYDGDRLDYLLYRLEEREAGRSYPVYRVVRLLMLRYLPSKFQSDPDIISKMQSVLTGFYRISVNVDLVNVVANIDDPPVGVAQFYGVVAVSEHLDEALDQSSLGLAALRSAMAGEFSQIMLAPPDPEISAWLVRTMVDAPYAVTVVGHPDPREVARNRDKTGQAFRTDPQGKDGAGQQQQVEKLFRAMREAGHGFILQVMGSRVSQRHLSTLLTGLAEDASVWKSRMTGTKAISFNLAVPISLTAAISRASALGYTEQQSESYSRGIGSSRAHTEGTSESDTVGGAQTWGISHTVGQAHTEGVAHTSGVAVTEGVANTEGQAHTDGISESWGESHSVGHAEGHTESSNWSAGVAESHGTSSGSSWGTSSGSSSSSNWGTGSAFSNSHAESEQAGWSQGQSAGGSHSEAASAAQTNTANASAGVNILGVHVGGGGSSGVTEGYSVTDGTTWGATSGVSGGSGVTDATGQTQSYSMGGGTSYTEGASQGGFASESHGTTTSFAVGGASSDSIVNSESWGTSHGVGVSAADTTSRARTQSAAVTYSQATTHSSSDTRSESWGESYARTSSWAHTEGQSQADSVGMSESEAVAAASGAGIARNLGVGRSYGFAGGIVPSLGASKTYQWVDDGAAIVGELLTTQERLLREAVTNGGYLTDVYALLPSREAVVTFEAAVRQAFTGTQDVATAVQPRYLDREEQEYIHLHACAFTPATMEETVPGLLEGYRHTTLLPPRMLAAFVGPGIFEEGPAVLTQEELPSYAFYGEMGLPAYRDRGLVLAHQWSVESGKLTNTPFVLLPDKHFHTSIQGDTGTGKSELAMRLALELAMKFHRPVLTFEFGTGWRGLFNSPLPRDRFELYQLYPGAPRPLRWPLLRVPRRVDVGTYVASLVQILANAAGMGERQISLLQGTLRYLYLQNGVPLKNVPKLLRNWDTRLARKWQHVTREEARFVLAAPGALIDALSPDQMQRLVVYRSGRVGVTDWINELRILYDKINNQSDKQSLSGAINRLERLCQGHLEHITGAVQDGEVIPALEELPLIGPPGDEWGVTVIEGGLAFGDNFTKAALFGLMLWTIYTDLREEVHTDGEPRYRVEVFIEEANKVLVGAEDTDGKKQSTPTLFEDMWRDSRKAFYLHPITQTISALSSSILASCGNSYFFQSKDPADVDQILPHVAKSPKGVHDLPYVHHVSRLEVGACVVRRGLSKEKEEIEMSLIRPRMVARHLPNDETLRRWYQAQALALWGNIA